MAQVSDKELRGHIVSARERGQEIGSYGFQRLLILAALLFFVVSIRWGFEAGEEKWWGYLVHLAYLALVALFMWTALSRKEYKKLQRLYPNFDRKTWILLWLPTHVVLPLLGYVFSGLPHLFSALRR